jgi:hypothetical protein
MIKPIGKIICHVKKTHKGVFVGLGVECSRCGAVLAEAPKEENIEEPPIYDKSYWNGCKGKVRFETFEDAKARLQSMKNRPVTMKPYHCKHCGKYHLGNKPDRHYIPKQ